MSISYCVRYFFSILISAFAFNLVIENRIFFFYFVFTFIGMHTVTMSLIIDR